MKKILIGLIALTILLVGCLDNNNGDDELRLYKGIQSAEIPEECLEFRDDVCGLFTCMVNLCWCDEGTPPGPILQEGTLTAETETEVMQVVQNYLSENNPNSLTVKRATKLNNIFFNVFAEDQQGNETVFTVTVDQTILRTMCGV